MWSVKDLKPYLLHDKKFIRDYAAFYIAQFRPTDSDLLSLVIEGVERFGVVNQLHVLRHAFWYPISAAHVPQLVEILNETTDDDVALAINWILAETPAEAFAANDELLRGSRNVAAWAIQRLKNRDQLSQLKLTAQELWAELHELAGICNQADAIPQEIEAGADAILLTELAKHNFPTSDEITQQLRDSTAFGSWLDMFLMDLAGRRRLSSAAPEIVRRLAIGHELVTQRAAFALGQIGEVSAVHAIQSQYRDMPITSRPAFIAGLQQIRLPETETALLALLNEETDLTLKQNICNGLCILGSKVGIDHVLKEVESQGEDGWGVNTLLVPMALMHGVELPNAEEKISGLETYLAQQEEQRLTMRRFDGPHSSAMLKARMATPSKLKAPAMVDTIRRESGKVGRNDPCSCGSGKKYKKCCGN